MTSIVRSHDLDTYIKEGCGTRTAEQTIHQLQKVHDINLLGINYEIINILINLYRKIIIEFNLINGRIAFCT